MAKLTIRDNALWAKHIEGDERLVQRILALPQNAPITLLIDGQPVAFRKMRDGADGRPTPGLRADPASRQHWAAMQERRGDVVGVEPEESGSDVMPDLESLSALLEEWNSPSDAEAYDRL